MISTEKIPSSPRRNVFVDVLRVFAIISVVFLHSAAQIVYQFNSIDRAWWWTANIFDSCCRIGVPLFIMISGMLLLDKSKSESSKQFFRKRFNRVVIPFVAWSVIYSFWKIKYAILVDHQFSYSISGFASDFLSGQVYFHLGFFYYLIGLYIITPILRPYTRNASNNSLMYFLVLWFLATPIYSIVNKFAGIEIAIPLYFATGFIGYFILGHFLNKIDMRYKYRMLIYLLGAFSLAGTIFGTYFLTEHNNGILDEYFYSYLSANAIVLSSAIFLANKQINWPKQLLHHQPISRLITDLSSASFGIYLIHPIIMELLNKIEVNALLVHPAIGITLTSILTILISFILVRLLQKIPLIRRIIP